jgi:argininosuccinate lyase
LTNNLPSGYHRDMQLTKECLFPAIIELHNCLDIAVLMLENIHVKKDLLSGEKYKNLFTVEALNALVLSGVPFRDAYRQIAQDVENNNFLFNGTLNHVHEGSIGNLCNDAIKETFYRTLKKIQG